jgi:hypothetical protein
MTGNSLKSILHLLKINRCLPDTVHANSAVLYYCRLHPAESGGLSVKISTHNQNHHGIASELFYPVSRGTMRTDLVGAITRRTGETELW